MTSKRCMRRRQSVRGSEALKAEVYMPYFLFALSKGAADLPNFLSTPATRRACGSRPCGSDQVRSPPKKSDSLKSIQITPLFWPVY
jgi:hypothetical protein